jgi:EutQ-like cupin domain
MKREPSRMEKGNLRLSQSAITPLAGVYSSQDGVGHVKPIAGTQSCQAAHTGYVLEGRRVVKLDDGSQAEFGPGDGFYMPPGHDAWIVGDKRCVMIDFNWRGEIRKACSMSGETLTPESRRASIGPTRFR